MILRDFVYAIRTMRKTPLVTVAVILTLALAIGANTAIFSMVQAVMLNPLPYPHADRLVRIWEMNLKANQPFFSASVPNFQSFRESGRSFKDMACWRFAGAILMLPDGPERINGAIVSGSTFGMLGIRPLLGRGILPGDEDASTPVVLVLTHQYWASRFGSDPRIVGKSLIFGAGNVTVAGVVPSDDVIFKGVDAFVPMKIVAARESRGNHVVRVVARLRGGVTVSQADAELKTLAATLEKQYPDSNRDWSARLDTAFHWIVPEEVRRGLAILLAAVGMVLLIACANISNLMLARATARSQEMAVRKALGAATGRLVRQLLTESGLLALVAGTAGVLLAYWCVAATRNLLPDDWPRAASITVNQPVLLFSILVTVATGLLFGLAPAWHAAKADVSQALKSGGRGATAGSRWMRHALVAGQLAMATALTAGAGFFLQSLLHLQGARLGFAPDHVLVARIGFPQRSYPNGEKRWQLSRQFLADIRNLPGIRAAGLSSDAPLAGGYSAQDMYPVGPSALAPTERFFPEWRFADPDYFRTLDVPLKEGRFFTDEDAGTRNSLIVSEAYARKLWPGESAVGKQMRDGGSGLHTIVGVVGDVRNIDVGKEPLPINYFPSTAGTPTPAALLVRTAGDPLATIGALRARMKRIDPSVPIFDVSTMEQLVSANSAKSRWNTWLIAIFAGLALILGALGIYGVLAYAVTLRTREIGVRMALGASSADIQRLMLGEGMTLAALGIGAGVLLAIWLGQLAASLLYGVDVKDTASLASVAVIMGLVALAASVIPARRAARVDPLDALRME